MPDAVVIGAGIAGLAAAWEIKARGLRPLVLEQASRAGGVIVTDRVDGFIIDGGPDSLLVQKPAGVELARALGLGDRLVTTLPPRTAFVLRDGKLVALPEASFLGLPTRLRSFISTPLFSWGAKLRMAAETLIRAQPLLADESIGRFMRRRFGEEIVTSLAEPLLAGIHAGQVDQLSIHALFPRLVDLERRHGSVLRGLFHERAPRSANGAFVSFPDGLSELVDALVAELGDCLRVNSSVEGIDGRGPFVLRLHNGETVETTRVILTAPAWRASSLLRSIDKESAQRCAEIPYASSATVAFGLRRDQVGHPLNGTGFVVPRAEKCRLMAATWVSSKWPHRAPDGHVLLRAFLGGASDPEVLSQTDAGLVHTAYDELRSVLDITGEPLLTRVYRWSRSTPQYNVGHLDRVRRIDDGLARIPGLYVTGSGYHGTGIPDCIADARATAAKAAAFLR